MRKITAVILFTVLFIFPAFISIAQNRYIVFFNDKNNSPYSVNQPEQFLSARAIERRNKQQIPIIENDLPVNPAYVEAVKNTNPAIEAYYTSRWFNALLIEADVNLIPAVEALPMVKNIELVAPGNTLNPYNNDLPPEEPVIAVKNNQNHSTELQNEMIGANVMHQEGYTGEGLLIAVFDAGFPNVQRLSCFQHIYNEGRLKATKDFTLNQRNVYHLNQHGTNVLSAIAGVEGNYFTGIAPHAEFILCITEATASEYRVEEYNWLFAAEFADSIGVDIINTSLGYFKFDDPAMDYTYQDMDGQTTVIARAANMAASKGILNEFSAGNMGNDPWHYIISAADSEHVLTTGAVTNSEQKASFSSFGPSSDGRIKPDVSALGAGTTLINSSGNVFKGNGTSFSGPLIAGLAAGVWQAFPDSTNKFVIQYIRELGSQFEKPDNELGYGIPYFEFKEQEPPEEEEEEELITGIFPNPISGELTIALGSSFFNKDVTIQLIDAYGQQVTVKTVKYTPDIHPLKIKFNDKAPGLYFLKVTDNNNSLSRKLIKI